LWWGVGQNYQRQQEQIRRASDTDRELVRLAQDVADLRSANDTSQRRQRVRERLGAFLTTGQALQRQFTDPNRLGPTQEAQRWLEGLRTFVRTELGEADYALLESPSGLMPFHPGLKDGPHKEANTNAWVVINRRLMRIQELLPRAGSQ
jgi:hypothetical protein